MSKDTVDLGHLSPKSYVKIWAVLLVLLFLSLFVGIFENALVGTILIFGVAIIKAVMVGAYFMHLKVETWWIKTGVLAGLVALFLFFIGVYPDVTAQFLK